MIGCRDAFFGNNRAVYAVKGNMTRLLFGTVLGLGAASCCVGAPAPALRDLNGVLRQPLAAPGGRGVALLFIADDCPISNSYAPEINRLAARFTVQGVLFYLVNTDTHVSAAEVKKHGGEYGLTCLTLLDPGHALAKYAGATATPEAAVYAPNGALVYRGRIDNRYVDFGKVRPQATTHDLQAALTAFLAHKPIPQRETKPVGCYL